MLFRSLLVLSTLICSTLAAPVTAPAPVISSRDTQWSITSMKRGKLLPLSATSLPSLTLYNTDCGALWLEKCNYSFVIHDDTGAHQCTISNKQYALSSWGPSLCAENYDGLVNISWSYKVGSGTLKVVL